MPVDTNTGYGVTLTAGSLVAEVTTITPAASKISSIQTTNLTSVDQAHTFVAGFEDAGEISFTVNLTAANWGTLNALAIARTESNFVVAIPAPYGQSFTYAGFITSRGIDSISPDGLITATFTVKVSGICYPD